MEIETKSREKIKSFAHGSQMKRKEGRGTKEGIEENVFSFFLPSYLTSQHVGGYVFPFLIATNIWFPLFENSSTMSSILSSLETCPPSFAIVAKCQRKISRLELRVELIAAVVLVLIVALLFSLLPLLFSSSFLLPFFFSREKRKSNG